MTNTKRSTAGYASASAAVIWVRDNATPCPGSAKPWLLGPARRTVRSVFSYTQFEEGCVGAAMHVVASHLVIRPVVVQLYVGLDVG